MTEEKESISVSFLLGVNYFHTSDFKCSLNPLFFVSRYWFIVFSCNSLCPFSISLKFCSTDFMLLPGLFSKWSKLVSEMYNSFTKAACLQWIEDDGCYYLRLFYCYPGKTIIRKHHLNLNIPNRAQWMIFKILNKC